VSVKVTVWPLVRVTWLDSLLHPRWTGEETTDEDLAELGTTVAHSVGWIIHESESRLLLAQTIAENRQFSMITAIPRAAVLSIEPLTIGDADTANLEKGG